jgi:hypothetical protein
VKVDPATLIITASNESKLYGTTFVFTTTQFTTSGLVNGDTVYPLLTSTGAAATATVTSPGPNYPIDVSDALIVNSSGSATVTANYSITYVSGTLTVLAPNVTLTPNSLSDVTYGTQFRRGCTATEPGFTGDWTMGYVWNSSTTANLNDWYFEFTDNEFTLVGTPTNAGSLLSSLSRPRTPPATRAAKPST